MKYFDPKVSKWNNINKGEDGIGFKGEPGVRGPKGEAGAAQVISGADGETVLGFFI